MTKTTGVKNRRLLITKNSILMLVVLVIIFLAIFAWYYINKNVSATGITITAQTPNEVQIAIPESGGGYPTQEAKWKSSINLSNINNNEQTPESVIRDELFKDVTGDGENLLIPSFEISADGEKKVALSGETTTAIPSNAVNVTDDGYNYIAVDFYVRSSNNNISLSKGSFLKGACEVASEGLVKTSENDTNKSSYGNFSKDAIVGAMRVSFVGGAVTANATAPTTSECKLLWLPRPDIYLNANNGTTTNWTLDTGIISNDNTRNTFVHNYYALNNDSILQRKSLTASGENNAVPYAVSLDFTNGVQLTNSNYTSYRVPLLGSNYSIGNENTATQITMEGKRYYIYKYTLNIWIEGSDAEARRAMDGGGFQMQLEFN